MMSRLNLNGPICCLTTNRIAATKSQTRTSLVNSCRERLKDRIILRSCRNSFPNEQKVRATDPKKSLNSSIRRRRSSNPHAIFRVCWALREIRSGWSSTSRKRPTTGASMCLRTLWRTGVAPWKRIGVILHRHAPSQYIRQPTAIWRVSSPAADVITYNRWWKHNASWHSLLSAPLLRTFRSLETNYTKCPPAAIPQSLDQLAMPCLSNPLLGGSLPRTRPKKCSRYLVASMGLALSMST